MKKLLTFSIALFLWNALTAQSLIAVQHEGQSSFFTELQSALDAAVDGDTVYLPGGGFQAPTIDKSLHLIGAGYHTDSTSATTRTIFNNGYLTLNEGAEGGSIEGVYLGYGIQIPSSINGYRISKCHITNSISGSDFENFLITENFIGGTIFATYVSILGGKNLIISNNIIAGEIAISFSKILNNVFAHSLCCYQCCYQYTSTHCLFENNVLNNGVYSSGSTFFNNVNGGINGVDGVNGNQGSGNFFPGNGLNLTYPNYIGIVDKVEEVLVLPANSPYKNAGTNGSDVGIYGGLYPWKAGGVPYNPHIQTKTISPTTNAQGSLNVQIRVAAQEH